MMGCDLLRGRCSWCHAFATCLQTDGRGHINTGLPSSLTQGLGAGACAFFSTALLPCSLQYSEQELLSGYTGPEIQVRDPGELWGL